MQSNAGGLPPGTEPRAVAADPAGYARQRQGFDRFGNSPDLRRRHEEARDAYGATGMEGNVHDFMAENYSDLPPMQNTTIYDGGDWQNPRGPLAPGGGRTPPFMPKVRPWNRPGPEPTRLGGAGKPRPGPGMMPPEGEGGGGIPGGPRVPPNMRGYLQRQRMMNRPPANVGGGANRVGMADQQGALSRAMQRGTGRPPMSRRSGFGRAR